MGEHLWPSKSKQGAWTGTHCFHFWIFVIFKATGVRRLSNLRLWFGQIPLISSRYIPSCALNKNQAILYRTAFYFWRLSITISLNLAGQSSTDIPAGPWKATSALRFTIDSPLLFCSRVKILALCHALFSEQVTAADNKHYTTNLARLKSRIYSAGDRVITFFVPREQSVLLNKLSRSDAHRVKI